MKNVVLFPGQMLCPEDFGQCLGIEAYPVTKSILKRHFMPEIFISIDNNLQRRVRLHNIDRLSHNTVFLKPPFLYAKRNIWREPQFSHVIPVSVLSIFIATAYDILQFTAEVEIKI